MIPISIPQRLKEERFYTVQDIAKEYAVHTRIVYGYLRRKKVPTAKIGSAILVPDSEMPKLRIFMDYAKEKQKEKGGDQS